MPASVLACPGWRFEGPLLPRLQHDEQAFRISRLVRYALRPDFPQPVADVCALSRCDLDQHQLVFRIGEEPLTASLLCLCAVHVLPASLRALRQRAIATWNAIELQELWIIRNEVAPASIKRRGVPLLKLGWWLLILEAHVENSSEPGKSGSPQSTCSCFLQKRLILFTKRVLIGKLHIATGVVEITLAC